MLCYKCNREIPDNSLVCSWCGSEMSIKGRTGYSSPMTGFGVGIPMNWFKFLIYFMLFFDAIGSLGSGILYISGQIATMSAGEDAAIYSFSYLGKNFRIIDIIYGCLCTGAAVFAIYTRFRLAKFKTNAIKIYLAYCFVSPVLNILYSLAFYIAVKADAANYISLISTAVTQGLYIYFNYIYFNKRKHLFNA